MDSCEAVSSGGSLGNAFHQVVENSLRKGRSNNNSKAASKVDFTTSTLSSCELELHVDPSYFTSLALVRKLVLKDEEAAAKRGLNVLKPISNSNLEPDVDDELTEDESRKGEKTIQIPQVVVISLQSIFDLIKESQTSHPDLCIKVLNALLGVLQNLLPESLKNEPQDVVEPLYELLLNISSSSVNSGGKSLAAAASSCLLSLVLAWGVTPKVLQALNHLITAVQPLATHEIILPAIMLTLQKGVQSVVIGSQNMPDWFINGIEHDTLVSSFLVAFDEYYKPISISCDGNYVYLLTSHGTNKIGTGFGDTVSGKIYASSNAALPVNSRNLFFLKDQLYLECRDDNDEIFLYSIDRNSLTIGKCIELPKSTDCSFTLFTDGNRLGTVYKTAEDELLAHLLELNEGDIYPAKEIRLRLALQSLFIAGQSFNDENTELRQLHFNSDEGFIGIATGKEFTLMTTSSGKVLYMGKASSLGMKSAPDESSSNRWSDLALPKCPAIVQCATGHEGQHAVLVDACGISYFVGLARRGEDGDLSKHRRQPKSSRPKRFALMDGKIVSVAACNNGSSALVTKDGELYIFGKDSTYCDAANGRMSGLKEVHIVNIALGKAHGLALTDKGIVYSFGINNKGQCGRDGLVSSSLIKQSSGESFTAATAPSDTIDDDIESEDGGSAVEVKLCPSGSHRWRVDQCMICTQCNQCTGFGNSCVNTNNPGRLPGGFCGCGSGESGCVKCGICAICGGSPRAALGLPPAPAPILSLGMGRGVAPLAANGAVLVGRFVRAPIDAFAPGSAMLERINFRPQRRDVDDPKMRDGNPVEPLMGAALNADDALDANRRHRHHRRRHPSEVKVAVLEREIPKAWESKKGSSGQLLKNGSEIALGSDGDREHNKLASLSPGIIILPTKARISMIACGLHHSILLTVDGLIFTFGSNNYGQLGVGDLVSRGSPTLVKIPFDVSIVMIAAGSHHSVALTMEGDVLTWGAHIKGQLARESLDSDSGASASIVSTPWHSVPGFVTRVGPKQGKRASWIGASGDQTFFKLDESLINEKQFQNSTVVASNNYFAILPTHSKSAFHNLVISRNDGQCTRSFSGPEQVEFTDSLVTWDSVYGVLWSFCRSTSTIRCYNVLALGLVHPSMGESLFPAYNELQPIQVADIFRPALALPLKATSKVTQTQAALHLLCCLDSLTRYQQVPLKETKAHESQKNMISRCYTKEDFSVANRFESHGGGWGYSGHSVEAVRFMSDTDVLLGGFSLFGGRGEYMGKIKVFDLGASGGEQEGDGELMAETDEVVYECGARQRYPILFSHPVRLQANRWYLAWARVNGPSSDCGSGGQSSVATEEQVTFSFKSSKKSNNGTDVNAGQIPQILFRVLTPDSTPSKQYSKESEVHPISPNFSKTITPDSFIALLNLTQWAWSSLKLAIMNEADGVKVNSADYVHDMSHTVFVCRVSMRLLRFYILELYPPKMKSSKKLPEENLDVARAIVNVRTTMRAILSDPIVALLNRNNSAQSGALLSDSPFSIMLEQVIKETHKTFVDCFHVFYPTAQLKWTILCDLLDRVQKVANGEGNSDRLLAAVMDSLCNLRARLRLALPNLYDLQETLQSRQAYPSPDMEKIPIINSPSEHDSPILTQMDSRLPYPVLVEHMVEGQSLVHRPCRAVLDRLYLIATWPVRQALDDGSNGDVVTWSDQLQQYACRLLARVVAELASQVCSTEELDVSTTRAVHVTPSRFTSVSPNRSWNTGNGSPDAICFTVDRPNVSIVGVGIFGGGGNYTYELELLELIRESGDSAQTLSWHSLAIVRGTYGPDDCVNDICEVRFDRPVSIKENTRYTFRLRNQGGKTLNGDGGLVTIKGPDGTSFNFSACLLSFNGTNHIRGQLPFILYCNLPNNVEVQQSMLSAIDSQVRKSILSITSSIVRCTADLLSIARSLPIQHSLPIINKSHIISYLLPYVVANVGFVVESDTKSAVQILELIRVLLPHVSALCLADILALKQSKREGVSPELDEGNCITTSPHIVSVESEHPYRPATVAHYRVCFPESVRWMCLEFDSQCCTTQVEDSLQLYLPSFKGREDSVTNLEDYWPVLSKFSGTSNWPSTSMILPGNEVIFSLETATDYVRNDKSAMWGFRCSVVGYEWQETGGAIRLLESELAYLGGMCAASLMKRDLPLKSTLGEEVNAIESLAQRNYTLQNSLLGKGIALSHLPTIHEALEGNLPLSVSGKERQFLRDFVSASDETTGGRLARWLQPESVVDPARSQLLFPGVFSATCVTTFGDQTAAAVSTATNGTCNSSASFTSSSPVKGSQKVDNDPDNKIGSGKSVGEPLVNNKGSITGSNNMSTVVSDGLRAGWPTILTLLTRDQYGHLVHVPNLKVDIRAVPCDLHLATSSLLEPSSDASTVGSNNCPSSTSIKQFLSRQETTFFDHPNPCTLEIPYEVTTKDRMMLHAITFLKAYENFSFEELRFMSPVKRRTSETMLVRPNADGSYSANWTPSAAGLYSILVTIDGYPLEDVYKVDVKEPPQGVLPPSHNVTVRHSASPTHRIRQFRTRASAGLRVRAQPSLQGEQIGIVACEGTISFIEELCNDDGTWLRLSQSSVKEWCCSEYSEAWCLQYNQHTGKTLLFPIKSTENKINEDNDDSQSNQRKNRRESEKHEVTVYNAPQTFYVVDCGASGHNIRARPSLKALPVGKLKLGCSFLVTEQRRTSEGVWTKLLPSSALQYCFTADVEAWSLAVDRHQMVYLRHEDDVLPMSDRTGSDKIGLPLPKPAYDFSESIDRRANLAAFSSPEPSNTFIFGPEKSPPTLQSAEEEEVTKQGNEAADRQEPRSLDTMSPEPLKVHDSSPSISDQKHVTESGTLIGSYGALAAAASGRLSAFQNWLQRDGSIKETPPTSTSRSKTIGSGPVERPPELQGVSVKDMVRVMGESRVNGNASPSPSPVLGRKSGVVTTVSAAVSRSLSVSRPERSPLFSEAQRSRSLSPAVQNLDVVSQVGDASPMVKSVSQAGTQTSPESNKGPPFHLGMDLLPDVSRTAPRLPPKSTRPKERTPRGAGRSRKSRSPTNSQHTTGRSLLLDANETACVGMSPSTAECLRAVFAANLWHQGLVHDAMACASFLKFHPNLPKQVESVVLRGDQGNRRNREERARQRHSVEILSTNVSAASFSSVLPVALEESWNAERMEPSAPGLVQPPANFNDSKSCLTPTLSLLVELWEKLSEHCMDLIHAEAVIPGPVINRSANSEEGVKSKVAIKVENRESHDKERKRKSRKETARQESNCELCGGSFPIPVTAHMHQAHPGCQKPALGLGYNPDGQYCGGWVGNCGEGGIQGSSWYLLCEDCRHRYLQQKRQVGEAFGLKEDKGKRLRRKVSSSSITTSSSAQIHRPSNTTETHITLKDNALFLLQLASSSGSEKNQPGLERRRKSLMHQPSLSAVSESAVSAPPQRKISVPPSRNEFQASCDSFPWLRFQCLALLKSGCSPQMSHSETMFGDGEADNSFEGDPCRGMKENPNDLLGRQLHRSVSMISQPLAEHLHSELNNSANGSSQRRRINSAEEQGMDGGLALLRSPSKALQDTVKLISSLSDQIVENKYASLPVLDFVTRHHNLESLRISMELALRKAACRVFAMENLSWLLQNVTQPVCLHDLLWWLVSSLAPSSSSVVQEQSSSSKDKSALSENDIAANKKDNLVGEHPTSDVGLAGEGLTPLLHSFHGLLQTVSDLMQLLPMGTPLLTMAVRCWDIRFKQTDHAFLHKSHVFSNISRILSRCEEEAATDVEALETSAAQMSSHVTVLNDVMDGVDVKVSSRAAMVTSLTDGSTETFWESGDEDRGKMKFITLQMMPGAGIPRIVCVYVDNGRDMANKVSGVTFKYGSSADELQILDAQEVDSRFAGWIHTTLPHGGFNTIQVEFKGPDSSLRVRQVRLLGGNNSRSFNAPAIHQRTCETETLRVFRLLTSQVFGRLVSNEIESSPSRLESVSTELDKDGELVERTQDIDLKEHMVGILFSGKKLTALTHLQRQVCAHILHGIQRETIRLREEWESLLQIDGSSQTDASGQDVPIFSRVSDSYCFELLSQVLALSGSRIGRTYISQQTTLPADLLSLLHTGSPRIQRQVTALLRRMLPELPPPVFASLVGVDVLPSTDYGILQVLNSTGSLERVGILDVFLACIAKGLTLQVKSKGRDKESHKTPVSTLTMATIFNDRQARQEQKLGSRWWMRGTMPRRVAESIIQLVRDMASGTLSEMWSAVTKASIAEAVLALTKLLDEERRGSVDFLHSPSLWLTLAALCLLQDEHVERLSSTQWARGAVNKPQCTNHDDGETGAQIVCSECGPLCIDCDRVLHLSRKFRSHQRQVCKEEEEAIKVDVHEGCGRVKLFWILALSDARNLKSLVEFRNGATASAAGPATSSNLAVASSSAGILSTDGGASFAPHIAITSAAPISSGCRYCGSAISPSSASLFDDQPPNVCSETDCQEHLRNACSKNLICGHPCGGVRNESECLPCLFGCSNATSLKQDADDMCMICFTEALSAAPAIQLSCKHVFHAHCCQSVLSKRWPGPRITFSFSRCPICKAEMEHEFLNDLLLPIRELFGDVKRKALMRLEYEGLHQNEAIALPGSRFYQDPEGFAMERYAYYVCFKCKKAYYGGEVRCEAELVGEGGADGPGGPPNGGLGGESFNPDELVCGGCSDVSRAQMCPRHGADYLEYKCRYCCSVAVFFCFGTTHFCNSCHEDFRHVTEMPKHALPKCPAGPRGRQIEGEECPLHLVHPPTGEEFALGCGICRNAHTF